MDLRCLCQVKKSQSAEVSIIPNIHLFIFYLYTIDSICISFLKFSIIELENGLVVVKGNQRGGGESKMGVTIKRQLESSSW